MAESFGTAFTLVEVTPDDFSARRKHLWVAAAKPDQAVTLVLMAVPEGWTAELSDGRISHLCSTGVHGWKHHLPAVIAGARKSAAGMRG